MSQRRHCERARGRPAQWCGRENPLRPARPRYTPLVPASTPLPLRYDSHLCPRYKWQRQILTNLLSTYQLKNTFKNMQKQILKKCFLLKIHIFDFALLGTFLDFAYGLTNLKRPHAKILITLRTSGRQRKKGLHTLLPPFYKSLLMWNTTRSHNLKWQLSVSLRDWNYNLEFKKTYLPTSKCVHTN